MKKINDITLMLHHIVTPFIQKAKIAIDCTCGNGYDSEFILSNLHKNSILYGFDIQEQAIKNSVERLEKTSFTCSNFNLICDSHSNIDRYVSEKIDIAFFNLGYLPGADHSITTKSSSTIEALEKILFQLNYLGIISIIMYHGHETGKKERADLLNFFSTLDEKKIKLMRTDYPSSPNNPPEIYLLQNVDKNGVKNSSKPIVKEL